MRFILRDVCSTLTQSNLHSPSWNYAVSGGSGFAHAPSGRACRAACGLAARFPNRAYGASLRNYLFGINAFPQSDDLRAQLFATQLALESNDLVTRLTDTQVCELRGVTFADLVRRHRRGFFRGLGLHRWLSSVVSTGAAGGHVRSGTVDPSGRESGRLPGRFWSGRPLYCIRRTFAFQGRCRSTLYRRYLRRAHRRVTRLLPRRYIGSLRWFDDDHPSRLARGNSTRVAAGRPIDTDGAGPDDPDHDTGDRSESELVCRAGGGALRLRTNCTHRYILE